MNDNAHSDTIGMFRHMAELIERTQSGEFAGAVCIVAPDGASVEYMLTDAKPDTVFFWLGLKSRIDTLYAELEARHREQEMAQRLQYGGRR